MQSACSLLKAPIRLTPQANSGEACYQALVGFEPNTSDCNGLSEGIRTPDPLIPNQVRYQTALHPDISGYEPPPPPNSRIFVETLSHPCQQTFFSYWSLHLGMNDAIKCFWFKMIALLSTASFILGMLRRFPLIAYTRY